MHPVLKELRTDSTPITLKYKYFKTYLDAVYKMETYAGPIVYYPHLVKEHMKCLLSKIHGTIMQSSSIKRHCSYCLNLVPQTICSNIVGL